MAFPQLGLTLGYSRYQRLGGMFPSDVADQFAGFLPSVTSQYSANLTLTQLVYNGGQVNAGLRAAALAEKQAARGVDLTRVGAVYAARQSYAHVLAQKALLEVATESVALAASYLDDVKARREAGMLTRLEELQAEVQHENAKASRIRARAGLRMARDGLLRLLGLDQGERRYAPARHDEGWDR